MFDPNIRSVIVTFNYPTIQQDLFAVRSFYDSREAPEGLWVTRRDNVERAYQCAIAHVDHDKMWETLKEGGGIVYYVMDMQCAIMAVIEGKTHVVDDLCDFKKLPCGTSKFYVTCMETNQSWSIE